VLRVDTVVFADQLDHVVDEREMIPSPAAVGPVGRYEDCPILGQLLQPEVGHVVAVRSSGIDFLGVATIPMEAKDQPVGLVAVVVVGQPHRKAAIADADVTALTDAHGVT
jgi:hypothetical protein